MVLAPVAVQPEWRTAHGVVRLDRPIVAGILNVTPDSFWDGGRHTTVEAAVRHAAKLVSDGADMLDIGAESTRPGAVPVAEDEEIARAVPVIGAIRREWPELPISIDTVKATVARAALDAGASAVNDVSGLRLDAALADAVARAGAGVIIMHSRGDVDSMARYDLATYGEDPVAEVRSELMEGVDRALTAGVPGESIVIDPGLGFSKRTRHSLLLLAQLGRIVEPGYPVLVGPSRKRFTGDASGQQLPVELRLEGTIAACVIAHTNGARLFRVHDVAPIRRALDFAHAARAAAAHQNGAHS